MLTDRREFLKAAGIGAASSMAISPRRRAAAGADGLTAAGPVFDIRDFGAKGNATTVDTPAVNRAIEAAARSAAALRAFPLAANRAE